MSAPESSNPSYFDDAALEAWLAEALSAQAADAQAQAVRAMVDHMQAALVPVQPSMYFVHELGQALIRAAGSQTLQQRYRRTILIGVAAAGSIVSVVGLAVYVFRQRERIAVSLPLRERLS